MFKIVGESGLTVRQKYDLKSPKVTKLASGTVVHVVEIQGRRCRIVKPCGGWVSLRSRDGFYFLQKLSLKIESQNKEVVSQADKKEIESSVFGLQEFEDIADPQFQELKKNWIALK
eukprot:UN30237